jgi:hypothetical protein
MRNTCPLDELLFIFINRLWYAVPSSVKKAGNFLEIDWYILSAFLLNIEHNIIVKSDTPTIIDKKSLFSTPRDIQRVANTKLNSPIWALANTALNDVSGLFPSKNRDIVQINVFPTNLRWTTTILYTTGELLLTCLSSSPLS